MNGERSWGGTALASTIDVGTFPVDIDVDPSESVAFVIRDRPVVPRESSHNPTLEEV